MFKADFNETSGTEIYKIQLQNKLAVKDKRNYKIMA